MLKQVTITQLVLNCMGPATCGPFVRVAFVGTLGKCMMGLITFGLDFLADRDIIPASATSTNSRRRRAGGGQMAGRLRKENGRERGRTPQGVYLVSLLLQVGLCDLCDSN